jgi:Protein of unknown function (DUF2950)
MKQEMMSMINAYFRKMLGGARSAMVGSAALATAVTVSACLVLAQQSSVPSFPSAAEATETLFQAVQSNNEDAIANILGGPTDLTSCGDPAQDQRDREIFVQKYKEMHRVGLDADGSETLYIGSENWPFPIPLVEKNGAWRFDLDKGRKEIMYRRIGENELRAILICHELVAAERQFRASPKATSQVDSLLAPLASAAAKGSAGAEPVLIHGYYFRVVANQQGQRKASGGFGFVAYPAEYRSSGVMTFIVTARDAVREKDLGANTATLASALTTSSTEKDWVPSDDK